MALPHGEQLTGMQTNQQFTVIHSPSVTLDYLRYQIIEQASRRGVEPVYSQPNKRGHITGFKASSENVWVRHLIGFGSTEKKALEMAQKRALALSKKN